MPKTSVILPTKNRAAIIGDSVKSILNQTLTDWELLVIDDKSTDDTEKLITAIGDKRIKYFKLPIGTGPAAARHFGIAQSQSEIISFCDSDDISTQSRLEISIDKISKGADVTYGMIEVFDENKNTKWIRPSNGFDPGLLKRINYIPTPTVTLRKSLYYQSGGFNTNLMTSEDYDLWLKLLEAGAKFTYIKDVLVKMRVHEGNITKTTNYENRKNNLRKVRSDHQLPVPIFAETIGQIEDTKLIDIFSTDHQKQFWFTP